MSDDRTFGQVAYEAWRKECAESRPPSVVPLSWGEVDEETKREWGRIGNAVARAALHAEPCPETMPAPVGYPYR